MLAFSCLAGTTTPTAPSPLIMLEAERVIFLELDELALVCRQEDAAHEARYAKLLDYLKQVNLQVELAKALRVQPVLLFSCTDAAMVPLSPLPLTAATASGAD